MVTLQLRNIASAAAHVDELQNSEDDILVWSETSATATTLSSLRAKAKQSGQSVSTSAPVGARLNKGFMTSGRGEASGALVVSKFPLMNLNDTWNRVVFQTGRIADAIINVDGTQIRIIAVYGYHSGYNQRTGPQ